MAIKVLLIDQRTIFVKNFENYINQFHKGKIDLFTFSTADKFNTYCKDSNVLHRNKSFDVLLCNADLYSDIQVHDGIEMQVLLVGDNLDVEYKDFIKINKYEQADVIIDEINRLYMKNTNKIVNFSNTGGTNMIFIHSPIGGAGKTTISLGLAHALFALGKKVLYIPLSLDGMVFQGQNYDFGYIISSKDSPMIGVEIDTIKFKYNGKFDVLPGFSNSFDYYEIEASTWQKLLENIKKSLDYDYIIIDSMDVCHENTYKIMEICDYIMFVANGSTLQKNKFDLFVEAMKKRKYGELLKGAFLIKNQSTGKKENYLLASEGEFRESIFIPYDSHLKYIDANHQLFLSDTSFTVNILKDFSARHF